MDGGLDAQTIRLEGRFGSRAVGGRGVIVNCAGPERAGNRIEQACSRQLSSVRARFPRCGVAVLACELAGLPWSAVNLAKLSLHATGKGNARKPEMQTAAKARWGIDLKDDMLTPLGLERMRRMAASLQRLRENVALPVPYARHCDPETRCSTGFSAYFSSFFSTYRIVGPSAIRQEGPQ
jgi:hypothetical protein